MVEDGPLMDLLVEGIQDVPGILRAHAWSAFGLCELLSTPRWEQPLCPMPRPPRHYVIFKNN